MAFKFYKILDNGTEEEFTNIVADVDSIEDVGTGNIRSAKLILGDKNTDTTLQSYFDQFDLVKIVISSTTTSDYTMYMIVDTILPQNSKKGNNFIMVLFGREKYLEKVYALGHYPYNSYEEIIDKILSFYTTQKGSKQPNITLDKEFTYEGFNNFDFGDETSVYDALDQIIESMARPTGGGGLGEFYGLTFRDTDKDNMVCIIKPQGYNTNVLEIKNIKSLNQEKNTVRANIVKVRGRENASTVPNEVSWLTSWVDYFENLPDHYLSKQYKKGQLVYHNTDIFKVYPRGENNYYECIRDSPSGTLITNTTYWERIRRSWKIDEGANIYNKTTGKRIFTYSPLTFWNSNFEGNLSNTGFPLQPTNINGPAFVDFNNTIDESVIKGIDRRMVDFRISSESQIPSKYLRYNATVGTPTHSLIPNFTRILLDSEKGTIVSPFSSINDKRIHTLINGSWVVSENIISRGDQIVVKTEGTIYEYNKSYEPKTSGANRRFGGGGTGNETWRENTAWSFPTDCFHRPAKIFFNSQQIITTPEDYGSKEDQNTTAQQYGMNSPFTMTYHFHLDPIFSNVINNFFKSPTSTENNELSFFNDGWWITMDFPIPLVKQNNSSTVIDDFQVGRFWDQSVMDFRNLNESRYGESGYKNTSSDDLGEFTGISFSFLYSFGYSVSEIDLSTTGTPGALQQQLFNLNKKGDIPFLFWFQDISGNIVTQTFSVDYVNKSQQHTLLFSGFSTFKPRTPLSLEFELFLGNILLPEVSTLSDFDWRFVKRFGIASLDNYDSEWRYNPVWSTENILKRFSGFSQGHFYHTGSIDSLCFVKTPLSTVKRKSKKTSGDDEVLSNDIILESPIIDYPYIGNIISLKNAAYGELDLRQHRQNTITVEVEGRTDIRPEEKIRIYDKRVENDNGVDYKEMVVLSVNYSNSEGYGFTTLIECYDKFEAQ